MKPNNAAVIRFGQTFFVVADTTGSTMTRETAEANCIARFDFEGLATKSNPRACDAYESALKAMRKAMK